MPRYRVDFHYTVRSTAEVEAEDREDAEDMVQGGNINWDVVPENLSCFWIDDIEEIEDED